MSVRHVGPDSVLSGRLLPDESNRWPLRCIACGGLLGDVAWPPSPAIACRTCGAAYPFNGRFLDCLPEDRLAAFADFAREYGAVRRSEGRGGDDSAWYLRLPLASAESPLAWQWAIRRQSFRHLMAILPAPATLAMDADGRNDARRILDLGAGNGWLSFRLSQQGFLPAAVDVLADDYDGLGAARHFERALGVPLACFRAEFDRLPFADHTAHTVIFNASFHYSADYRATLAEAMRVLGPDGHLVVMDSPIYSSRHSGEQMVRERKAAFTRRFGFASDALGSREYVTMDELRDLGQAVGIHWQEHRPWYGWRWAARLPLARLGGKREPARFALLVGKRA